MTAFRDLTVPAMRSPSSMVLPARGPIYIENQQPGTTSWIITRPATNNQIEGYASATSVNRGDRITFHVSTTAQKFDLAIYRMGWYQGHGGRLMHSARDIPGRRQRPPTNSSRTPNDGLNTIYCRWTPSYDLDVPADWCSGVYLAKLSGGHRYEQYIIFVVRDDLRKTSITLQLGVVTYQAYNDWSIGSNMSNLYGGSGAWANPATAVSPEGAPNRAYGVSFDRPYGDGLGSGQFFFGEYSMVRWLEANAFDVKYCTNIDIHLTPNYLLERDSAGNLRTMVLVTAGHHEYWSWPMREHVERAVKGGVSLAFPGSNNMYWQVRIEDSYTGVPGRRVICYKDVYNAGAAVEVADPLAGTPLETARWRDLSEPEQELLGLMYGTWQYVWQQGGDFYSLNEDAWPFEGTGMTHWSPVRGIYLYECDYVHFDQNFPPNLMVLGISPIVDAYKNSTYAHATIYRHEQGGSLVFSAGTKGWSWGLDDISIPSGNASDAQREWSMHGQADPRLQRLTWNILMTMSAGNCPSTDGYYLPDAGDGNDLFWSTGFLPA